MKITIKEVKTKKTIPVTRTITVTEKVEVFKITKAEIESAFLKWGKATDGISGPDNERSNKSPEENCIADANEFIHWLKTK